MDKKFKTGKLSETNVQDEDGAFEIIELAIDDINVLTRAFQVINNICEELSAEPEAEDEADTHSITDMLMH